MNFIHYKGKNVHTILRHPKIKDPKSNLQPTSSCLKKLCKFGIQTNHHLTKKTINLQKKVPKALVWVIAKVVISCLNLVVMTCVMNQYCNHLLLFNILTIVITLFFIEFQKSMKLIIMTIYQWHLHVKNTKNIIKSLQDEMVKTMLVLDGRIFLNQFFWVKSW